MKFDVLAPIETLQPQSLAQPWLKERTLCTSGFQEFNSNHGRLITDNWPEDDQSSGRFVKRTIGQAAIAQRTNGQVGAWSTDNWSTDDWWSGRLIKKIVCWLQHELYRQSSFYLAPNYFINPASSSSSAISPIQLLVNKELFHKSSFYFITNYFINPASSSSAVFSSF